MSALPPAARNNSLTIAGAIFFVAVIADQVTKYAALKFLEPFQAKPVLGSFLQLRLVFNPGAAWGLGAQFTWVVALLQFAIAVAVLFFLIKRVADSGWAFALGCILGGAIGNIIDRLFREPSFGRGHVVDFIELPHWPIFNVADMFVVAGSILVILLVVLNRPYAVSVKAEAGE